MPKNYKTFDVGPLRQLADHVFDAGRLRKPGKIFLSERLESNSAEISFNRLEPKEGYEFLHRHNEHEEIYLVVSGRGDFMVDGEVFQVQEGSTVRVAPEGVRSIRAGSGEPLTYLCVQAVAGTLKARTTTDGRLVPGPVGWDAV